MLLSFLNSYNMKWRFLFSEELIAKIEEPPQVFKLKFVHSSFEELWENHVTLEERDFYGFYGIHFVKLIESLTSKSEEEIISLMGNDRDSLKKILEEAFEKKKAAIIV